MQGTSIPILKGQRNQPHHAGGCVVFDPLGDVVAQTDGIVHSRRNAAGLTWFLEKLWEAREQTGTTRCAIAGRNYTKRSA